MYDERDWSKPDMAAHIHTYVDEDYDLSFDPRPQIVLAHWCLPKHLNSAAAYLLNSDYRARCKRPDLFDLAIKWLDEHRDMTLSDFEDPATAFLKGLK